MQRGPEAGEVDQRIVREEFQIPFNGSPSAEGFDHRRIVIGHRMMNAANNRHPIHPAGSQREEFSQLNAGDGGGNRLIDPADFLRGLRLHVPQVEMTGTAVIKKQNAGADG